MRFDVFFSLCQTEVDGWIPDEPTMFRNFFSQVEAADALGYTTAWIAESHLSCEVQKSHPDPVIPRFRGEIGLNTDVLLLAQKVFARTKRINVGSAIRSILVNGGPMAHAEAVKSFLTLHGLDPEETRRLELGFAAGRFKFSSEPYGIVPRGAWEKAAWPVLRGKIFLEACEVFLRFLRGDVFSSLEVEHRLVTRSDFRDASAWDATLAAARAEGATVVGHAGGGMGGGEAIVLPSRWTFPRTGVIPSHPPLRLLRLLVGSHDPAAQDLCNRYFPCGVFNLSITPGDEIERTHERMKDVYAGASLGLPGEPVWSRALMPRTTLVFLDETPGVDAAERSARARAKAEKALMAYWNALEGTLDPSRIRKAVDNALVGTAEEVAAQARERFHPDDRLMLWFDFFNHDCADVVRTMETFAQRVVPLLETGGSKP
jgi:alkanesulfonate monooxygenase SsuD/methylene tetrahydromethanopterin reductase-like flavin-dependent oxidoreductase (luciferase family)